MYLLTEVKILRRGRKKYTKELYKKDLHVPVKDKKDLHVPVNHDAVITHLGPDIPQCKIKWALGNITMNKASGGGGIPVELFQFLKEDSVKVLYSICQQIWKTQKWPQD